MSIDQLAHTDSLELQAMFFAAAEIDDLYAGADMDELEREMGRLWIAACESAPDPMPEDLGYPEDGPRAYAH